MSYKFCPKCAALFSHRAEEGKLRLTCSRCHFIFYQNSKPTVCALIIDNDRVLLGKRKVNPSKGLWDIPGGFLEEGEHPEDGLKREIWEETKLKIKIEDFIGFFNDTYHMKNGGEEEIYTTLNICYSAKIMKGRPTAGDDVESLKLFKLTDLPKKLAFNNTKEILKIFKKFYYTSHKK